MLWYSWVLDWYFNFVHISSQGYINMYGKNGFVCRGFWEKFWLIRSVCGYQQVTFWQNMSSFYFCNQILDQKQLMEDGFPLGYGKRRYHLLSGAVASAVSMLGEPEPTCSYLGRSESREEDTSPCLAGFLLLPFASTQSLQPRGWCCPCSQ